MKKNMTKTNIKVYITAGSGTGYHQTIDRKLDNLFEKTFLRRGIGIVGIANSYLRSLLIVLIICNFITIIVFYRTLRKAAKRPAAVVVTMGKIVPLF